MYEVALAPNVLRHWNITFNSWSKETRTGHGCLAGCRGLLAMGGNSGLLLVLQKTGCSVTHRAKTSGVSSGERVNCVFSSLGPKASRMAVATRHTPWDDSHRVAFLAGISWDADGELLTWAQEGKEAQTIDKRWLRTQSSSGPHCIHASPSLSLTEKNPPNFRNFMFLLKYYSIYKVQKLKEYTSASNQRSVIQWPRGLRHRSVGAPLLGLRVRNPLGAWRSVCLLWLACVFR